MLSLRKIKEEAVVDPFTGEPDKEMEIFTTDGEAVTQAKLVESYLAANMILKEQLDHSRHYFSAKKDISLDMSIYDKQLSYTHRPFFDIMKEDKAVMLKYMTLRIEKDSYIISNLIDSINRIPVKSTTEFKSGKCIPFSDLVQLMNLASSCFGLVVSNPFHADDSLNKIVERLHSYTGKMVVEAAPHYMGYNEKSYAILKEALPKLIQKMEEAEAKIEEQAGAFVSDEKETVEIEDIDTALKEEIKESLHIIYHRYGMHFMKCVCATICTLGKLQA